MEDQHTISFNEVIESLKKHCKLIIGIISIFTIITFLASTFLIKPTYQATAKVFIGKENQEEGYSSSDITMYQQLLNTYSETIKTKDLINKAIDEVNIETDVNSVLNNLIITPVSGTQILKLDLKNKNADDSKKLLKSILNEFIVISKELVPNGNIKIIEDVELPKSPISPNITINTLLAFIIGVALSIGISFLIEFLDNTYKNKEVLEKELSIPVIGVIPKEN